MQTVSNGDNLHEMSEPVFEKKNEKNIINITYAEYAYRVVKVKMGVLPYCGPIPKPLSCWIN